MISMLKTVGLVLWWAEGTKSRRDTRWKNAITYPIEITNTDPKIISIFLDLLRKEFNVDESKIKVQIQIHKGDNRGELENYWSNITNIPKSRFNKTIIRAVGNKPGKSKGTCKVRFSDKMVYGKLKSALDGIVEQL